MASQYVSMIYFYHALYVGVYTMSRKKKLLPITKKLLIIHVIGIFYTRNRFKNIGWIRLKYIFYYHIIAFLFILIGCS